MIQSMDHSAYFVNTVSARMNVTIKRGAQKAMTLDGVYIGPADLSQSFGYQERVDPKHPDLVALLDKIHDGCRRRGLITGIHVASVDYARGVIAKGFQFVTLLSDGRLLAAAAKHSVERIKGTGAPEDKAAGPY